MRFRNTETPVFNDTPGSGKEPFIVEEMDLLDRLGNVRAKFKKNLDGTMTFTVDGEEVGSGDSASYLVYTALLSQSGTDAPVATVLENTLGGVPVWARFNQGIYTVTLSNAFPEGKTFIFLGSHGASNYDYFVNRCVRESSSVIKISVYGGSVPDPPGQESDDTLAATPFEIAVYP